MNKEQRVLKSWYDELGNWFRVGERMVDVAGFGSAHSFAAQASLVYHGRRKPSQNIKRACGTYTLECRLAASVSVDQRDRLRELAQEMGLTWTELCRAIADGEAVILGPGEVM